MAKTQIIFSLLLLCIFIVSSSSSSNAFDFDTYQLVIQWDPATCSDINLNRQCSQVPHDILSIRSLLPAKSSPFQIIGPCRGSVFNPQNIQPIRFGLDQNWPDVISGHNEQLWREEWSNHGTCSEQYLDQLEYFNLGLNLFSRQNLITILSPSGIRPNGNVQYTKATVESAILFRLGVRPALHCNINNLYKTQQLHEFRLCYSRDSKALRNCSSTSGTCTDDGFYWYPYMRKLYGFFQLGFQWEPAICFHFDQTQECQRNPRIGFSISGVWPMTRRGVQLGPCNGSNFDVNQVSPIQVQLNRVWVDLFNSRTNEQLWGREWRNHGTCSEDQFGQRQYFSFGVQTYQTFDLVSILRSNNIIPNGGRYRRVDIEDALIRAGAGRPFLLCNRFETGSLSFQLHQILICYDDYGRRPQDCPTFQLSFNSRQCPSIFNWFP